MFISRHALKRLQFQRSALSETFLGALSLCYPQQAAYALSSDSLAESAPADSLDTAVTEHTSVALASPTDSAPQALCSEDSCAAWRHAPGIKGVTLAGQRFQEELRRPEGSSRQPGRVQCRSFSAQALPSKQSDEAEPQGFVRGGYSVEQFPPDKVCRSNAIPRRHQTTAALPLLSRVIATSVQVSFRYLQLQQLLTHRSAIGFLHTDLAEALAESMACNSLACMLRLMWTMASSSASACIQT